MNKRGKARHTPRYPPSPEPETYTIMREEKTRKAKIRGKPSRQPQSQNTGR